MSAAPAGRQIRDAFLRVYRDDLDRGGPRSEADYHNLFPGHEDEISAELQLLDDGPLDLGQDVAAAERVLAAASVPATAAAPRIGPYRLLHELGRGGQAIVYFAEHEQLDRRVALKVLGRDAVLLHSATELQRFRREAEASARLDHPHLCSTFEAGENDGQAWIAMRYVAGSTLAAHLEHARQVGHQGAVPLVPPPATGDGLAAVVAFVEKVARALHFAHERGLVHRDVKPGNVMVTEAFEPCVLDFGLAGDEHDPGRALTQRGTVVGTPYYLAPEQLAATGAPIDRRTDVYALGVTLYECLTLQRPFDAPSREALYRRILAGEPRDPAAVHRGIARDLALVVLTAMERDPDRRYATAAAFADDLRRVLRHEPIDARPLPWTLRTRRWLQRNPRAAALLAASTVVAVVSVLLQWRTNDALRLARARNRVAASVTAMQQDIAQALSLAVAAHAEAPGPETAGQLQRVLAEPFPSVRLQPPAELFEWWFKVRPALVGGRVAALHWRDDPRAAASRSERVNCDAIAVWEADGRLAGLIQPEREDLRLSDWSTSASLDHAAVRWADGTVTFHDADGRRRGAIAAKDSMFVHPTALRDQVWLLRDDGTQELLDWDGNVQRELPSAPAKVVARHAPRGREDVLLGCADGTIELRAATGQQRAVVRLRAPVALDGVHLAAGAARGVARLDDGSLWLCGFDAMPTSAIVPIETPCFLAQLSPDGQRLLTLHESGTAVLWDLTQTPKLLQRLVDPRSSPRQFERTWRTLEQVELFAADGSRCCTVYADFTVALWNSDGRLVRTVAGRPGWNVMAVRFLGDDLLVAQGPSAQRFDRDGQLVQRYVPGGTICSAEVLADDRGVALAGFRMAQVFPRVDPELPRLRHGSIAVGSVAVGVDGSVISGAADGSCWRWRSNGTRVAMTGHTAPVFEIKYSPDGTLLATASEDGTVIVRDQRGGTERTLDHRPLFARPRRVLAMDFDPTGPRLLTAYSYPQEEGVAVLWDLERNVVLRQFAIGAFVQSVQFARDGRSFLCANNTQFVQIRNLDGEVLHSTPFFQAIDVRFAPDGRHVLISGNGEIAAWDPVAGTLSRLAEAPQDAVWRLRFAPDGQHFAAASQDGSVWIYRANGEVESVLRADGGAVGDLAFTPDGRKLVSAHEDGSVRTWFVETDTAMNLATRRLAAVAPNR